ncbi:hypothetical protein COBT_000100 [Conglomerata obtusa]
MKFSKYLKHHKIAELQYYYLDYDKLEMILCKDPYTEEDEQNFVQEYENEMKQVFDFINVKQGEFTRRSKELEANAKDTYKSRDTVNKKKTEVTSFITNLQDEIKMFSEYIRINIVGFSKILKKHDKCTPYVIRPMYKSKLKHKIEGLETLDSLLYRISKIMLTSTELVKSKQISNQTFIRKTNKYWVHKENIIQLKCLILKHLPIYVYTEKKKNDVSASSSFASDKMNNEIESPYHNWEPKKHDTRISSVYLDNENFDLYKGRLRKDQGAEAIRIRYYTSKMTDVIFIERKRHEEDWTGEESKKLRFKIFENRVNDFLQGLNVWNEIEHLNTESKDEAFILYNEIQNSIRNKNLRPVVRTFYKRTAFQLPNSARVRISLDTSLCMIKECHDFSKPFTHWRRKDVQCEYPFYGLKKCDIVRFPYAVLEIKLEGVDETKPDWIEDLLSSSLVEHVHKFSKYIHGCSVLYPKIIDIPYWLPQMNTDIRKDKYCDSMSTKKEFKEGILIDIPNNTKNVVINDEIMTSMTDSSRPLHIDIDDKRIAIPVRVEPKVFFANERTFLSWLHFSIFIGGIGTAMMGLGDKKAVWSGIVFIFVSILFALYALYLYLWRAGKIRTRDPGPYDDLYGPAILVAVFLMAMLLSIFFKFPLH